MHRTEKFFSKQGAISYSLILIGSFIMAVSFVMFISPYKLAPGGVYGIAITLHHLYAMHVDAIQSMFSFMPDNLNIGVIAICMDIPLCLIGIKILGPLFGLKTVVGFTSLSIFTTFMETTWGYAPLVDDMMLSSIFGGVLIGIGQGLIFRAKATSGGSDIIAMITSKYTNLSLGTTVIIVDSIIVMITLAAFHDWKIPMYSWIVIYVTGAVIDLTMKGFNRTKTMLIISDKHDEITDKIINELERGATYIQGEGVYSRQEKKIIFTNISIREVGVMQQYIKKIDPTAFVTIIDANEVIGDGFKSIHDK